jgi:signal transduction histidine kinase/ligand-binding sensor domain-containing protein
MQMRWKLGVLCLFGAVLSFCAEPSVWNSVRPPIRTFGIAEGAPNMTVYAVNEDRNGLLWIGTQDGAASYDGTSWTTLNLPPESESQWIRALAETPDGSRWFGTEGGGLWRLQAGAWTLFRKGAGLPSNTVHSLLTLVNADGSWELWVSMAEGGVAQYDGATWRFTDIEAGLPSHSVWKIRELKGVGGQRELWAATTKGFARLEGSHWRAFGKQDGWPEDEANDITQIRHPDGREELWLSVWGRGMMRYTHGTWTTFNPSTGAFPSYFPITSLLIPNRQGAPTLWVCTYDRGLGWYAENQWKFLDSRKGLPTNGIYSLMTPRRGKPTLWMGMRGGGVVSLDLTGWYSLDQQAGLPSNEIHGFAETADPRGGRMLWIATNEGLARWERGAWKIENARTGLPHDHVACLLGSQGEQGTEVWAGTLKGLALWNGHGWQTLFKTQGLQDQRVLSLLETREAGERVIWAGTDKGLLKLTKQGQRRYLPQDGLPAAQIYSLASTQDADGGQSIWVGTRGYGIGRLKKGQWSQYGESEGLANLNIFCLKEMRGQDGHRWLWAGSFGGGASRLSLEAGAPAHFESFTVRSLPGLPSNVVVRIEVDPQGHLYLVTQRGVARVSFLDPAHPDLPSKVESFRGGDGLPPISTNYGASFLDQEGRLWVATNRGAAVLDPKLEAPPPSLPELVLEHVLVAGQPRTLDPKGTVLSHRENRITFDLALPTFYREDETRYRTQIQGLEPAPSAWSVRGSRDFLALPAGDFVLQLEARDCLGRVAQLRFPLRIRQAPWRSYWAYALYLLAAGVVLAGLYRVRTRLLRARNILLERRVAAATEELQSKNRTLQSLNEEKDHFLGIAAHDLRNPLNAIVLMAQQLGEEDLSKRDLNHFAGSIERASKQMAELIEKLLGLNRLETGHMSNLPRAMDIAPLVEEVCGLFELQAGKKGIRVVVEVGGPVPVYADPLHLRDVLENLVSNAIKFTPPGPPERVVMVRAQSSGDQCVLEVEDQGPGFTEEDKRKMFGRFMRLSAVPTAGEGSSGLGLSIVKRLVKELNGQLQLESKPGEGTRFRVHLPSRPA